MNSPIHIHCLGFWPDYDALFLASAQSPYLTRVINPFDLTPSPQIFSKLPRIIRECVFQPIITRYIKQYPQDIFIFGEHRVILKTLVSLQIPIRGSILLRNPISKPNGKSAKLLRTLQERGYTVWSFDPQDCARFGFSLYKQFIAPLNQVSNIEPDIDFSFIGRDKGRQIILDQLTNLLKTDGYTYDFDLLSNKTPNLSYTEYLNKTLRARCIIDIVQIGQTGLTLRPLEALIYKRKLLTNNPTVLLEEFYHPDNVLFISEATESKEIQQFMNTPNMTVDEKAIESSSVTRLLDSIVN